MDPGRMVVAVALLLQEVDTRPHHRSGTLPIHRESGPEVACTMALDLSQATVGLYAPIPTRTHSLTETSSVQAVNWNWIGLSLQSSLRDPPGTGHKPCYLLPSTDFSRLSFEDSSCGWVRRPFPRPGAEESSTRRVKR